MKASFVLRQPLARLPLLRNLIALRKVNTLELVHRRQLMDQWRERPALFLGLAIKDIGQIGGGKNTQNGRLDLAVIQSLIRKGEVKDLLAEYGQVIVDECHHVSAFSFERVLKKVKAKYVVGLTATPIRKDGTTQSSLCNSVRSASM
jgi:superfamily II DNA or RNA helicase